MYDAAKKQVAFGQYRQVEEEGKKINRLLAASLCGEETESGGGRGCVLEQGLSAARKLNQASLE